MIPNGIDPSDLVAGRRPRRAARALRRSRTRSSCCSSGRLVYEKGFQLALEALPRPDRARAATCASSSPARARTSRSCARRRASSGSTTHGTFLGWIGDDVLHSLYRIADLTVVPSIYEPFGLVALEAMASGCPCLVADTGGLREVVPNERRRPALPLARPGVARRDGRAPAHRRGAARPAGGRGAEHVLTFDWADVARQANSLYEDVVGERSTV